MLIRFLSRGWMLVVVTAVMLSFAVRIYRTRRTLMIDECTESKG